MLKLALNLDPNLRPVPRVLGSLEDTRAGCWGAHR
jgi:hypothetical protein